MRAVIRRDNFRVEFKGRGELWNEMLRPWLGGPPAPPEPVIEPRRTVAPPVPAPAAPAAAVAAAQVRPTASPATTPAVRHFVVAGPGAEPVAATGAARGAPQAPRTWYPPRETPVRPAAPAPAAAPDDEDAAIAVEPSSDPATLYARLAEIPGRRSERDAVLAAVWFLTHGRREASADEVEGHFDEFGAFPDIKVVPHLLKHVHRTKMFEQGSNPKAVKFTAKGIQSVRGRLVPD